MLPVSTEINKRIPKQKFYENLAVTSETKRIFTEQIKSIVWLNKISPENSNITAGKTVSEIQIFKILLYGEMFDTSIIKQIDKNIPYHNIYLLESEDKFKLCLFYKNNESNISKLCITDWLYEQDVSLEIRGHNLDVVYENIVCRILGINRDHSVPFSKQIEKLDQRAKIEKAIIKLEKQARNEKQPSKKFELVQKTRKLYKQLEEMR